MYVNRNYGFWMTFNWSRQPFIYGLGYAALVALGYYLLKNQFEISIAIPWEPIGVLGVAVAFYLGFKNNSSYDRTWEARKIWGGIVNSSRSFGVAVMAFVQGPEAARVQRELIYRHLAWVTALRYQLRLSRSWEHTESRVKGLYSPNVCEDYFEKLDKDMVAFIDEDEFQGYKKSANMATQILAKQSVVLQSLKDQGYFEDFRHMEFHKLISLFYEEQGKSERIKNFPFPRQYASVALWMTLLFAVMTPFGMLKVFEDYSGWTFWLCVPFSALVIWVFFLMEKIGDYSENPFEGTYNDVPITSISRAIEIDLRQMLGEQDVPAAIQPVHGFLL